MGLRPFRPRFSLIPSARDGGGGDFGAVRHLRGEIFKEAHVFAVDVDVDESTYRPALITNAVTESRKLVRVEAFKNVLNCSGLDLNGFSALSIFSERGSG